MQGRENKMTGQRGLDGVGSRIKITNLTNHNHIRVLTQNISQNCRKGDINLGLDSNLVEIFMNHFHRVFHRDNIHSRCRDVFQSGI
jgi:ribosomal protein S28E/S33